MQLKRFLIVLCIALLGGCSPLLRAQSSTTGALTGTVTDPKGSGVRGAIVKLFNHSNNQTRTTTTGSDGLYRFSLLSPGSYEVEFYSQGFKSSQLASVIVNVSEVPVLDAILEVGESTEKVVCQCHISNTATSSTGTLVDSKTIRGVPLTTRNFTQVLSMSSGSAADVNNAGLLGAGSQSVTVNGNTSAGVYTVDGAMSGNTVPNPDTISEFKIQTSQYDAGYGVQVPNTNLITKSGENNLHGDVWEFVRNDIFNANDFFRKAAGQPRPNLKQNQFGGTLGGPIRKDKLFFFGSYQGTRQINGLDPTSLSTLILPPLTNDRSAAAIGNQFCPSKHGPIHANPYNTFAGGANGAGVQVACDGSNINPVALKLLQTKLPDSTHVVPTPQEILKSGPNAGLGFSSYSLPSHYGEDQYLGNGDYVISKRFALSGRFYHSRLDQLRTFGSNLFASAAIPNTPGFPQKQNGSDYITSLKLTATLTSNFANESRMAFTRSIGVAVGPGVPSAASIGMTPVDPLFSEMPDIIVQGSLGSFRVGNDQNEVSNFTKTYSWADNASWVRGKQTIRTGIFVYSQYKQINDTGPARGKIVFQNFTDFLLGMSAAQNGSPAGLSNVQSVTANEGVGPNGEIQYRFRTNYASVYFQDDAKVSSRLTLNLGLRWEYCPPTFDTAGQSSNAWPSLLRQAPVPTAFGTYIGTTVAANYSSDQINPYTAKPFGPPPFGVFVRPTNSPYQNGAPLDAFAPRFGFAWHPGGAQGPISLRGGYGWFYQTFPPGGNTSNTPLINSPPFAQLFGNTGASNGLSTLQKPFPTTTLGFILRTPVSQLTDRAAGPVFRIPRLQQWNLTAQVSFSSYLTLDIGYAGSHGNHLLLAHGFNQPLLATPGNPVNCGLPNTPSALGVSQTTFASLGIDAAGCVTSNTSANASFRVPFVGETPTALLGQEYAGASWYNSFQATLRDKLSHGLAFQLAYTFSKAENNTAIYNDQNNLRLDWGRATFDRTHRFIANYSYELPNIPLNGFASAIFRGWSVSGIVIIQSGLPMTLTDINGGSGYGFAGTSTITACPNHTYANLVTSGRDQARLNAWFNFTAICPAPIVDSDGSTGYGNSGEGIVTGPGQFNTDFSLGKTTRVGGIREKGELAFRVEFYNAFNHPQFANPGTAFGTSNFGVVNQTSVAPRLIQFGMKYLF